MPKKKKWQIEEEQKKKDSIKYLAVGGAVIMFIMALLAITLPKEKVTEEFAQCVVDSGAKMYGTFWCSHCSNQKRAFGDYWNLLKDTVYVECDARGENPQAELCIEEGIQGYPTWKFGNGVVLSGGLTVEKIAEVTGCSLK